ncbi:MAG: ferredoxin reductase [Actinomycetota bacterium]|nr:ferredoxin reductase [Actinomycetota bacterium]
MTAALAGRRRRLASFAAPLLGALTHPHGPDRYLELIDPTWSSHDVRAEIVDVRRPTPGAVTLLARPNRNWQGFRAGQHVQLTVDVAGVRRSRCYSVVSSQHSSAGLLEFTVHAEPEGLVSNHLQGLRPGTVVGLSQAQGPFTLPSPRPASLLLISGGSGITPALSMLRTLCDEGRAGSVTFLHYARTAEHVAYREELDALAAAGVQVLRSYTRSSGGELAGRFCPGHLAVLPDVPTWVCGPATLVEAVQEHWSAAARAGTLSVEHFTAPAPVGPVANLGEPTGEVVFAGSDRRAANTGAPLLEQAEAAGLTPVFGCRMGICFSCTRRKTEGTVRYANSGALHTEPDSDIQLCITVPVGDVTVDL